jgi:hypothetical protein
MKRRKLTKPATKKAADIEPCAHCEARARDYVDLSSELDRRVYVIIQLCSGVESLESMDACTLPLVGGLLSDLFTRRVVLEHHFFGRELGAFPMDEADRAAALAYVRARTGGGRL